MPKKDYLSEDPKLPGQKLALVTIVGPHLDQKWKDVWGIKIRGVFDDHESASVVAKRLQKFDNENYHIYEVPIGLFFPLDVSPEQVQTQIYKDEKLNELMQGYLENRADANIEFEKRKAAMISNASNNDISQDHPVNILSKIKTETENKNTLEQNLEKSKNILLELNEKYNKFTKEEQELAEKEFSTPKNESENEETKKDISEIRSDLIKDINQEQEDNISTNEITSTLDAIKKLETIMESIDINNSPNLYKSFQSQINDYKKNINNTKTSKNINDYINDQFKNSKYNQIFDNEIVDFK